MDEFWEKQSLTITFSFKDGAGDAIVGDPDQVVYKLVDVESGTEILSVEDNSPSGSTYTVQITAANNAMIDSSKEFERRRLVVGFTHNTNFGARNRYEFIIKNVAHLT